MLIRIFYVVCKVNTNINKKRIKTFDALTGSSEGIICSFLRINDLMLLLFLFFDKVSSVINFQVNFGL